MITQILPTLSSRRRFLLAATAFSTSGVLSELGGSSVLADDVNQTGVNKAGFVSLFDGKSLAGWHTNRGRIGHGSGGQWQVENGVLTGEQDPPGSGNGGLLLTDKKYSNFELSIDMNPDWGPCSGVFFRCTQQGAGYQMYVDYHDDGNVGHLRGEMPGAFALMPFKITAKLDDDHRVSSFTTRTDPRAEKWPKGVYKYSCTPEQWLAAWKIGQWNTARIRCVGKHANVTTWINGVKICHFDGATSTLPAYDKNRVYRLLGDSGSIGLQVHGGNGWPKGAKCRWRNIRIKEL